jgi:hypothetical protein
MRVLSDASGSLYRTRSTSAAAARHDLEERGYGVAGAHLARILQVVIEVLRAQRAVLVADQPVGLHLGLVEIHLGWALASIPEGMDQFTRSLSYVMVARASGKSWDSRESCAFDSHPRH